MADLLGSSKKWIKRFVSSLVGTTGETAAALSVEHWGLTALPRVGLARSGVSLHEMTARWGSPLHAVDADALRGNMNAFCRTPTGATAGCEVYYSYKTNPVPGVLRFMHEGGIGAEVISHYELWLARKLGVPGDRIVYNGPAKSPESIREAIECGVGILNLNHREEIEPVAAIARGLGRKARVGLRVSTDQGWAAQFGTPIAGGEALAAFRAARAEPSLDVVAVHAHRGGMIRQESELTAFLEPVLSFVDSLEAELQFRPSILNFGGSLATPTVDYLDAVARRMNRTFGREPAPPDPGAALSIERYVECLVTAVEARSRSRGGERPRVVVEPGRAMTGNTQTLLASVVALKEAGDRIYAVLDAGINHAEPVGSEYHQVFPVNRFAQPLARRYTLVGPICTPGDTLYTSILLPELAVGDTLAIMDSGAYFVPFSTSFSFPRPGLVMVDSGRESVLRRAETFDDLTRCDDL